MKQRYESIIPGAPELENLAAFAPLQPFAPETLAFVDALSKALIGSATARRHPELTALGYWMRKASLVRLEYEYKQALGDRLLVPRGTVFHVAPANVDTIFIYSWFLALLSGNRNIVRLSSKRSEQASILIRAIADLLTAPEHNKIAARTLLVRYPADTEITAAFSAVADVRVIWGGDATVSQIRGIPIPPTSIDIAFANKYSLAIIHAERWLAKHDDRRDEEIKAFWNDAYWFDQMACSSPRSVLWIGEKEAADRAARDFWERLDDWLAKKATRFADVDYVNKLTAVDSLAMDHKIRIQTGTANNLVRVWLDKPEFPIDQHCGAGLFFESRLAALAELRPLLSRTIQTVSYSGWEQQEIRDFVLEAPLAGIDRMVPFGQALSFSSNWDGFDLTRVFIREITVA